MGPTKVRTKILSQIQHMVGSAIIRDRRFLDDEQMIRSEQLAVMEEIFNANVRDTEIRELSSHFSAMLRGDHPCYLAIWGKTGTGKMLTLSYFLNLLSEMCRAKNVLMRYEHLDLSNPRPCFRALNELIFKPYDAVDLQHILRIRVEKALHPGAVESGVIEKIAAMASRDHAQTRCRRPQPILLPQERSLWIRNNLTD